MTIKEYEEFVSEMWFDPNSNEYLGIALGGEVGEVLNEIKKEIRDGKDRRQEIILELGDVLYYLVRTAKNYGVGLTDVMEANMTKLKERRALTGRP